MSLTAPEGSPDPLHPPYVMSVQQRLYLWLAGMFVTALLVANLIGAKFFSFGSVQVLGFELRIEHSVGMFAFPVTFLLTDLLNEYYGKKGARRVTFLGLGTSLFALVLIQAAIAAPSAPAERTFVDPAVFRTVFGTGAIMIVASLTAYMLGQLTDIWVFHLLKRVTGGRLLWLRATGSTVVSQAIDSLTISLVLGYGSMLASGTPASLPFLLETAAKGYALKFIVAIAITPLIYLGHGLFEQVFGLRPLSAKDPRA